MAEAFQLQSPHRHGEVGAESAPASLPSDPTDACTDVDVRDVCEAAGIMFIIQGTIKVVFLFSFSKIRV